MTANKAVQILSYLVKTQPIIIPKTTYDAIRLGSEALQRIQRQRILEIPINQPPLPGEDII